MNDKKMMLLFNFYKTLQICLLFISDLHDARMKQLRDLQKDIAADDWRYTPIEKLIGLQ